MRLRSALFSFAVCLAGAVLLLAGCFCAILLLTDRQCGTSGYLCEAQTANSRVKGDHVDQSLR
jgi:hypothetical protein